MPKTVRSLVLKTNGEFFVEMMDDNGDDIHQMVGGFFDVIRLNGMDCWVHDLGYYECDANPYATMLVQALAGRIQPVFGDVVFTGGVTPEGDTLGLEPIQVNRLVRLLESIPEDLAEEIRVGLDRWVKKAYR